MSVQHLAQDSFWLSKPLYSDAERRYYEQSANATLTPLADEVAKARQRLRDIISTVDEESTAIKALQEPVKTVALASDVPSILADANTLLGKQIERFHEELQKVQSELKKFQERLLVLENKVNARTEEVTICQKAAAAAVAAAPECQKPAPAATKEDDDDVDLFASDSDDDTAAAKIKEERLAAYNEKKSKKAVLIAKSSVVLDVKPWDDETDMKAMEQEVRKITMDGLLWGASKLVPLAFGIHKLQINCVVEDDKVSIDELQEKIESNEDYVQSVDIAAFNKI